MWEKIKDSYLIEDERKKYNEYLILTSEVPRREGCLRLTLGYDLESLSIFKCILIRIIKSHKFFKILGK